MTSLYRIEHARTLMGPFHRHDVRTYPTPRGDVFRVRGSMYHWPACAHPDGQDDFDFDFDWDDSYVFGVRTAAQLRHWFPLYARTLLGRKQYVLAEYEGLIIDGKSGTQCIASDPMLIRKTSL